ncbi:MAG: hypothetical protein ACRD0K_25515 [Egibacteraceae bacterium]
MTLRRGKAVAMQRPPAWLVVLAVQAYLFSRYLRLGAEFHYWLHGLAGAALGLMALTAAALARSRRPDRVWALALTGALYSAAPDILFIAADLVHERWMDAFAFHIAVHFVPVPLAAAFTVFAVALGAWAATALGRRALAAALLVIALAASGAALLARSPVPTTLAEIRDQTQTGGVALLCPLAPG